MSLSCSLVPEVKQPLREHLWVGVQQGAPEGADQRRHQQKLKTVLPVQQAGALRRQRVKGDELTNDVQAGDEPWVERTLLVMFIDLPARELDDARHSIG